jgi:hypothetical protein
VLFRSVNDDVFISALSTLTIMTVTRQPRKIGDDGITSFGESIE